MSTAKYIDGLTNQVRASTDCQVLATMIDENANMIRDRLETTAKEMAAIARNYMPIVSPPGGRPSKIVKWVKKLISGTIMPQIQAYAKLAIELAEIAAATSRLAAEVERAQNRLQKCDEIAYSQLITELNETRIMVEGPLNTTLGQVDRAQNDLQTVIDTALNATFDISSVDNFLATASDVLPVIEEQVAAFTADETPATAEALGSFDTSGEWVDTGLKEVRYEDGVAVEARDRATGITDSIEVVTGATLVSTNEGTIFEPVIVTTIETTTATMTFDKGILVSVT